MFRALMRANPAAPVDEFVGDWPHTEAMRDRTDLPKMLAGLGLLPSSFAVERLNAIHHGTPGTGRCVRADRG
jgi:hypothetical protein